MKKKNVKKSNLLKGNDIFKNDRVVKLDAKQQGEVKGGYIIIEDIIP